MPFHTWVEACQTGGTWKCVATASSLQRKGASQKTFRMQNARTSFTYKWKSFTPSKWMLIIHQKWSQPRDLNWVIQSFQPYLLWYTFFKGYILSLSKVQPNFPHLWGCGCSSMLACVSQCDMSMIRGVFHHSRKTLILKCTTWISWGGSLVDHGLSESIM